ncbi:hypothetical protein [Streptosporangium longisporum]|uniref:Uncharacterized protein n=1 Tax=Streptosporangium longisporum TaxID=46187 RepID=A0ABN3Y2I6_9ACTN
MPRSRKAIFGILCLLALFSTGLPAASASAQASVPDRWGFALVTATSGTPPAAYQAGSWPAGFTVGVTPGGVGQTHVRFPKIGIDGGVVHVTSVAPTASWCQAQRWVPSGGNMVVTVQCYRYGGTPAFTPYSIVFAQSSGTLPAPQAFGYVHHTGSFVANQFNSAGGTNVVSGGGVGVWTVRLPGLGSAGLAGNLQVTAVDATRPARCKVGAWTPSADAQLVQVRCHNATDVPLNTGWTLTYQRERAITGGALPPHKFGYTFDNLPYNSGPYVPVPAAVNHNGQGSVNGIQSAGVGMRLVTFGALGSPPDHIQVTAYGPGPEYCNLQGVWVSAGSTQVRNVACYSATTRMNRPSFVSHASLY